MKALLKGGFCPLKVAKKKPGLCYLAFILHHGLGEQNRCLNILS